MEFAVHLRADPSARTDPTVILTVTSDPAARPYCLVVQIAPTGKWTEASVRRTLRRLAAKCRNDKASSPADGPGPRCPHRYRLTDRPRRTDGRSKMNSA